MLSNKYTYLDERVIAYINFLTKDLTDFDEERFSDWLAKSDCENKNNPSGYVRSCFKKELNNGTFKPKPKEEINEFQVLADVMPTLYKYLEAFDVDIEQGFNDETYFVEELQLYIVLNNILTIDELNILNDKVMGYITNFEDCKLSDYRKYIKQSQTLKDKVNWEEIEKRENERRRNFERTIKMFEQREVDDYD